MGLVSQEDAEIVSSKLGQNVSVLGDFLRGRDLLFSVDFTALCEAVPAVYARCVYQRGGVVKSGKNG
jgi:hypothetical protein